MFNATTSMNMPEPLKAAALCGCIYITSKITIQSLKLFIHPDNYDTNLDTKSNFLIGCIGSLSFGLLTYAGAKDLYKSFAKIFGPKPKNYKTIHNFLKEMYRARNILRIQSAGFKNFL